MPNDIPNSTWSEVDASNTSPVPNGAPEGWFPADVNGVYRMGMGATKRFWDHLNFTETTTGTSTAYVLTYEVAPQQLFDGEIYSFLVGANCSAAPTLNINSLGAKGIRKFVGGAWVALEAGDLIAGQKVAVAYNFADAKFDLLFRASADAASLTANNTFSGTQTFENTVTMDGAPLNEAARVDVASATTCDIGAAASNYVRITGTTTITGLGTIGSGARRHVVFAGALTLAHNATSLILPAAGANIVTAAGDCALFESEGSGNWRCLDYQRADGTPVVPYTPPQSAYVYATVAAGVVTIQKQSGVTSVVRTGTGAFTVTLSSAMPDTNYRVLFTPSGNTNQYGGENSGVARTTTVFGVYVAGDNQGNQDPGALNILVLA